MARSSPAGGSPVPSIRSRRSLTGLDDIIANSSDSDTELGLPIANGARKERMELQPQEEEESSEEQTDEELEEVEGENRSRAPDASLFTHQGRRVRFAFVGMITNNKRRAYTQRITEHGGLVTEDPEQADTVLVPSQQKQIFIQQYMGTSSIYVEPHDFVDLCIRTGEYFHKPRNIQGIGGRPRKDGRKRTSFTAQDDQHLVKWIGSVCPCMDCGGRNGNKVYKILVHQGETRQSKKWALRHTWQSWRQRYVKNSARFDPLVDVYLSKHPPKADNNGRYLYGNKRCPEHLNCIELDYSTDVGTSDGDDSDAVKEDVAANSDSGASTARGLPKKPRGGTLRGGQPRILSQAKQGRRNRDAGGEENATSAEEGRHLSRHRSSAASSDLQHQSTLPTQREGSGDRFTSFHFDAVNQEPLFEPFGDGEVLTAWHAGAPIGRIPQNSQATLVNPTQPPGGMAESPALDMEMSPGVGPDYDHLKPSAIRSSRKRSVSERILDGANDAQAEVMSKKPAQALRAPRKPRARPEATTAPALAAPGPERRITRARSRSVEARAAAPIKSQKGKQRQANPIPEEDEPMLPEEGPGYAPARVEVVEDAFLDAAVNLMHENPGSEEDEDAQAVLDELGVEGPISEASQPSQPSQPSQRSGDTRSYVESRVASGITNLQLTRTSSRSAKTFARAGAAATRIPPTVQPPVARPRRKKLTVAQAEAATMDVFPPQGTRAHSQKRTQEEMRHREDFVPSPRAQAVIRQSKRAVRAGRA